MITKRSLTLSMAAGALALATAQTAQASLIIGFQLDSGGTTTKLLSAADVGTMVNVQVWGTVLASGTVGIANAIFRAQSQQVGVPPGAFSGGGATTFGFTAAPTFNNIAVKGSASDVSLPPDGINDLGILSGASSVKDPKARAQNDPVNDAAPAYYSDQGGWTPVTGGYSIQLGTFPVKIGTLVNGGVTKFNVSLPQNTPAASWFENATIEDGTGNNSPTTGTYASGTSVSFISPTYKFALTTNSDGTLGTSSPTTLPVFGSNKLYYSTPTVPANGTTSSFHIANASLGVGGETPVLVMVEFDLGTSGLTLTQLANNLLDVSPDTPGSNPAVVVGTSPDLIMSILLAGYNTFDPTKTLLFEYTPVPGAISNQLDWGFDLSNSGVSVIQAIAVPEPASVGLLAVGAVGLLKRRRR